MAGRARAVSRRARRRARSTASISPASAWGRRSSAAWATTARRPTTTASPSRSNTANRVLFPKPEHYDPSPFVADRWQAHQGGHAPPASAVSSPPSTRRIRTRSIDANWCDFAGNSEGYAEGDWATRERIAARIRDHFQSRLYYFQNDPELPEAFRTEARTWGLPKDEFTDNGHFPFQLYVREARRMVGRYVLREQDLTQDRWKPDGIATGSYGIDCHVVQYLRENGRLVPEHTRHVALNNYDIPYAQPRRRRMWRICSCPCAAPPRTSPTARCAWSRST